VNGPSDVTMPFWADATEAAIALNAKAATRASPRALRLRVIFSSFRFEWIPKWGEDRDHSRPPILSAVRN
jgi:hypothetical protein